MGIIERFRQTGNIGRPKVLTADFHYHIFLFLTVSDYHPNSAYYLRSSYIVGQERRRHFNKSRYIIHPMSCFRLCWQFVMALVWTGIIMGDTFIASFLVRLERENYNYQPALTMMLILNCICIVDIVLNFRTGYYDKEKFILTPCKIACHYLKTFFFVDIFVVVHFITIYALPEPMSPFLFQITYSLQFVRIIRIASVITNMRLLLSLFRIAPLHIERFLKFLLIFFYMHTAACVMCYYPDLKYFITEEYSLNSWVIQLESLFKTADQPFGTFELYLQSILNVLWRYNCSFIEHQFPVDECILHCVILTTTTSIFIFFVSRAIYATHVLYCSSNKYTNFLAETEHYMRKENIRQDIQREIEQSFKFNFCNEYYEEQAILETLENIKDGVRYMFSDRILKSSQLLRSISDQQLCQLMGNFRWFYLVAGNTVQILRYNRIILFLLFGTLAKYEGEKEICHYKDGDCIDEALQSDDVYVIALENCYIAIISDSDFREILQEPDPTHGQRKSSALYS